MLSLLPMVTSTLLEMQLVYVCCSSSPALTLLTCHCRTTAHLRITELGGSGHSSSSDNTADDDNSKINEQHTQSHSSIHSALVDSSKMAQRLADALTYSQEAVGSTATDVDATSAATTLLAAATEAVVTPRLELPPLAEGA
eukprot:17588-Heterococcus_DN1.PRE.2